MKTAAKKTAAKKPTMKKNAVDGYFSGGIFRPIRKSDDYNEFAAGDYDSPEEKRARQEKNAQKAFDWYNEQLEKEMYGDLSLSEYVRKAGGIYCAKPTRDKNWIITGKGKGRWEYTHVPSATVEYGEIMRLSLKESGKRGLVTHKPEKKRNNNVDDMRRSADESGYRWGDQNSISQFLDAVEQDARAKRMKDKYFPIKENPKQFVVAHTGNKTVVTMPDGKTRITLAGKLDRLPAIKKGLAELIKKNPTEPDVKKAAKAMTAFINELDTNGDGDVDRHDVRRVANFSPQAHTAKSGDASAVVLDSKTLDDGVLLDETKKGQCIVTFGDNGGQKPVVVSRESLLFFDKREHENEPHNQNPVKYILSYLDNSTGRKMFLPFDSRMKAVAKRHKLEKKGKYSNFKIRSEKPGEGYKQNPSWLSIFAEAAVGLSSALQIQNELEARRKKKTRTTTRQTRKNGKSKPAAKPKTNPKRKTTGKATKPKTKTVTTQRKRKPRTSQKNVTKPVVKARASSQPRKRKTTKRNPEGTFEMFTGRESTKAGEYPTSHLAPRQLDELGKLHSLKLVGQKEPINFMRGATYPFVLAADKNDVMWICGGRIAEPDATAKANELEIIGVIDYVVYQQKKVHLGDTKAELYKHKLGEEGGKRPELALDKNGFPVIHGGDYTIEAAGIRD